MILENIKSDQNIFSINVELTSTFLTVQRFGPSPSPNFKIKGHLKKQEQSH